MYLPGIIAAVVNPATLAPWTAAFFLSASLFSGTVALRLLLLALGVVLALYVGMRHRPAMRSVAAVWLCFAAWAAWAALSISWSQDPARSAKEFQNEIIYTGLAFFMCYIAAQTANAPRVIAVVLAVAGGAVSVVAIYSHFRMNYELGYHGGAGNHSSALLTLMPCAVLAAWYTRRDRGRVTQQAIGWALIVLFFLSAYFTLNRTIWLGFAAEFLILGAWLYAQRAQDTPARLRTKIAASLLIILVVGAAAAMTLQTQAERRALGAARMFENDLRVVLWEEAIDLIRERPLLGYGFGRGINRRVLTNEFSNRALWHSHNLFLDVLLQAGAPGLILLLGLLAATVRAGWTIARAPNVAAAACGAVAVAVVAGMVIRNMTDVLWVRQNSLFYWGVIGVLLAWGEKYGSPRQGRLPRPPEA